MTTLRTITVQPLRDLLRNQEIALRESTETFCYDWWENEERELRKEMRFERGLHAVGVGLWIAVIALAALMLAVGLGEI